MIVNFIFKCKEIEFYNPIIKSWCKFWPPKNNTFRFSLSFISYVETPSLAIAHQLRVVSKNLQNSPATADPIQFEWNSQFTRPNGLWNYWAVSLTNIETATWLLLHSEVFETAKKFQLSWLLEALFAKDDDWRLRKISKIKMFDVRNEKNKYINK